MQQHSVEKRILSAAVAVGTATIFVKLVAMAKEMAVAAAFGIGDQMDAFVIASMVPFYLINVAAGALSVSFVPTYVEVREREGADAARTLLGATLTLTFALLAFLGVLLFLAAPLLFPLIVPEFAPDKIALTRVLFALLLPTVGIYGITVIVSAVVNVHERFTLTSCASALVPLVIIAVLYLAPTRTIQIVAGGTVLGHLAELGAVLLIMRAAGVGLSLRRMRAAKPALKKVLWQYLPALSGSSLMCSAVLIDQTMAASLGSENASALNYGNKLVSVIIGAGTTALGTAVLPYFSGMAARGDWAQLRRTLKHYTKLILAVSVPGTLLFAALSGPLVRLVFLRGAFDAHDAALVAGIQAVLALQIPFHTLGVLYVRMVAALKLNRFMLWSNVISVVLNIGLNYALMQYMGVRGIALSTVIVYMAAAGFLGWAAWTHLPSADRAPETLSPLAQPMPAPIDP